MTSKKLSVFVLILGLNFVAINSAPVPQVLTGTRLEIYSSDSDSDPSNLDLVVEEGQIVLYEVYDENGNGLGLDTDDALNLGDRFAKDFVDGGGDGDESMQPVNLEPRLVVLSDENEYQAENRRMKYISINLIRIFLVLGLTAFLISFVSVLTCCIFCLLFRPNANIGSTYVCYEELPNHGTGHRDFVYNYNYDEALLQNFIQPQHDLPPSYANLSKKPVAFEGEAPPPSYSPSMGSKAIQGQ